MYSREPSEKTKSSAFHQFQQDLAETERQTRGALGMVHDLGTSNLLLCIAIDPCQHWT